MGTSGEMSTSNSHVKYSITISTNWQSVSENYSSVNVKVNFWRNNTGYETYGTGTVYCKINGTTYTTGVSPSQKITSSGITLFNKDVAVYHNNDGSKYLDTSAWISLDTPLSSSEQWYGEWLPQIPRAATFTNADNFNDEQNPKIYFNNPGGFKLQLKMEAGGNDHLIVRDNLYPSSPYTFSLTTAERNRLRDLCPNSNTLTVRFTVGTYLSGSTVSNHSYGDRTMTIVNANSNFSSSGLTYQDINTAVTAITGNNQLIVRNKSNLQMSFTSASAQKSASISKYQIIWNGTTTDKSSAGTYSLGAVNSSQNLTLQVKAIDTRGNSTTISKTVTILDWVLPIINGSASRINNYENETNLLANVQISSVNNLNSLQSLQYRAKKTSESSWGAWTDFQNNVQTQIILDNLFAWDLQIKATDKFDSQVQNLSVSKGMPIMFFDTQKLSVGVNCFPVNSNSLEINGKTIFDMVYPIGSIYMSVNSVNPSTLFGGTWVAWGKGRVPVGMNTSGTFNTVEKTGGAETHTLTTSQMPSHGGHIPNASYCWGNAGEDTYVLDKNSGAVFKHSTDRPYVLRAGNEMCLRSNSAGSGNAHNNLQPYITCFMWKRTA